MTCYLVRDAPPSSSSLSEKKRSAVHGVGEEEALVQTKSVPCFYKMSLHKVAAPVPFGTNLNCFSVPTRSLAGWALVGARCCRCRLECPLLLFPLPLPWYARCPSLLHSSLLPLTSTWLPRRRPGELAGRAAARLKGQPPGFRKNSPPSDEGGAAIAAEGEIPPGFQQGKRFRTCRLCACPVRPSCANLQPRRYLSFSQPAADSSLVRGSRG